MIITTHNGIFHADEVFAIVALLRLFPEAAIERTRDPKILSKSDLRVDVGGKNNPQVGDFDHHQREGAGIRTNGVPFASFGLVWKEFGRVLCGSQEAADLVDERLVQLIDAADCGVKTAEPVNGLLPYSVSQAISALNPSWQEDLSEEQEDELFVRALELAGVILFREITYCQGRILAASAVRDALASSDSNILVLEVFCPWQEVVVNESEVQLVVFPAPDGTWRVQCVPPEIGSFEQRKPLPENWAGLRGKELIKASGVTDAVFCHPGRFICGANSQEGALKMARKALAS